jgi:hypothetical protein
VAEEIALMDDVYLLNSPFTFQSMEKHAAYCAMLRLGLKVPETVLVPYKNPVEHAKYAYTAERYNQPSSGGSSTPARRWSAAVTCIRSTTRMPARMSRSPRCTITFPGRSGHC